MLKHYALSLYASVALAAEGGGGSEPPAAKPSLEVNTQVGEKPSATASLGADRKFASGDRASSGTAMDFNSDGTVNSKVGVKAEEDADDDGNGAAGDDDAADADDTAGDAPAEDEGADADTDEQGGEEEAPGPLPDYDPENEEVAAAYNERFTTEVDGKPQLNFENLGAEVYANSQQKGEDGAAIGKPVLNEGTYAWLENTLGIPREKADLHIAGEIAVKKQKEDAFYAAVGGKEAFDSQVKWGSENFTPAQKAKFNAAMKAGGDEAAEQIELLQARAAKGGWKLEEAPKKEGKEAEAEKPAAKPRLGIQKRPASPPKTASAAETPRGAGSLKGYANNDEYRAALKAAGNDATKHAEVRKNLAASKFWKANQG